jgi:hypothetical protein
MSLKANGAMSTPETATKRAELLAATGAFLLGIGVGAWFSARLAGYVVPLLILGGLCHGVGMYWNHRLKWAQGVVQPGWYRALYWLCWLLLTVLAVILLVRSI